MNKNETRKNIMTIKVTDKEKKIILRGAKNNTKGNVSEFFRLCISSFLLKKKE